MHLNHAAELQGCSFSRKDSRLGLHPTNNRPSPLLGCSHHDPASPLLSVFCIQCCHAPLSCAAEGGQLKPVDVPHEQRGFWRVEQEWVNAIRWAAQVAKLSPRLAPLGSRAASRNGGHEGATERSQEVCSDLSSASCWGQEEPGPMR